MVRDTAATDMSTAKNAPSLGNFALPRRLFGSASRDEASARVICAVDCHAGGEPARVIVGGLPQLPVAAATALDKRSYMMEKLDHIREVLMLEPRGYPCQNVDYLFEPESEGGDLQYVIAEQNKIYPLMSGHNTICVATAALECGIVPTTEPETKFTLQAPAGPIDIVAQCSGGKATSIALQNAPSFVEKMDVRVDVPHGVGEVIVDIAYGGMWYAVVDISQFSHLRIDPECAAELCRVGEMIKVACREQHPVNHPEINYPGVDILVFRGPPREGSAAHATNTVVMSNNVLSWDKPQTWTGMLDRSPCGTGTCAVMAVLHARGQLKIGEPFVHESIVGSQFTGTILRATKLKDGRDAVVPQIEGAAYVTQYSQVVVDTHDPFPRGYKVADIW